MIGGGERFMILESEIRARLAELLSRKLDLELFEDWLVQRSWNMHLDSDRGAQELASAVELALSEHSAGHLSERELRQELHALCDQTVAPSQSVANK
jgi:hypothetical protein